MNKKWTYVPFTDIFDWCSKSNIGSREAVENGKYKLFVASATEIKRYNEFLENGERLVFGTGGNPCIHYVNEAFSYTNHTECAKPKSENGFVKFYYYYFQKDKYKDLQSTFVGGGIKNSSKKKIGALLVPRIDYDEQKRIVAKIEELFSELDNGVETLKKTKQQLAVYRQAVLKEAFEGNYTLDYRKNMCDSTAGNDFKSIKIPNPIYKDTSGDENEIKLSLPPEWIKVRMGDVFTVEVGSTPSRRIPEYWNGDIPWVSSGEVHFNSIFETEECITQNGLDHASTNVHPIGTIMLAMIGEGKTRGQAAILNIPAAHNQNTAAILVSQTPCQPKYIYYFLQMNYENTRRVGSGNNQKALNKERVRALRFPFASFEEQKIIVEEIESRFSVCESIEKTVDTALQQAEAMRQSILKKAFEGEL